MGETVIASDIEQTLKNRERLFKNEKLLYWYEKLYEYQFMEFPDINKKTILEIGSGASPLKLFYPNVITSDIMPLEYLDHVLDAHEIAEFSQIKNNTLDIITMTNVLHHLEKPLLFLEKASCKLKAGGKLILTEPYFSLLGKAIYVYLHHEPVDFSIKEPVIEKVEGPLSSANIALPYLIFKNQWDATLKRTYRYSKEDFSYFSAFSYPMTGGMSKTIPIPKTLYKALFHLDRAIATLVPQLAAIFFVLKMTKR